MTRAEEVRRLRESLYRPDPPPGAVDRYVALAGGRRPSDALVRSAVPDAVPRAVASGTEGRTRTRRRPAVAVVVAIVVGALLVAAGAVAGTRGAQPAGDGVQRAERLTTGGPYAVSDRGTLDGLLDAEAPDSAALLRAVRGSTLAQLDAWDAEDAGAWIERGRGPRSQSFAGTRSSAGAERFSLVVWCSGADGYLWTLRGTTPERAAVHRLAAARRGGCDGSPTVATFVLPAGGVVRGLSLDLAPGSRWATAIVHRTGPTGRAG